MQEPYESRFFQVELSSGSLSRSFPLPAHGFQMMQDADGRILVTNRFNPTISVVGTAEPRLVPVLSIEARHLGPAEPARLNVVAPRDAKPVGILVNWDDGTTEELFFADQIEHVFGAARTYLVTVTVVYQDGRTASQLVGVEVGAQPPEELSIFQKAFSEYADTTWGILGIAIAITGGAVAIRTRVSSRTRFEQTLGRIEALRGAEVKDPASTIQRVENVRLDLRQELLRSRMTDSQYALLDGRAASLLKSLRARALLPLESAFSEEGRRVLRLALDSGHITPSEADTIVSELGASGTVPEGTRAELARMVFGWSASPD